MKLFSKILIMCAVALVTTACGNDTPDVLVPTLDESSVSCNTSSKVVYFKAVIPDGTKVQVLVCQQTNGNDERTLSVTYQPNNRTYYANLGELVGGSTYAYYIIGYDSNGAEAFRSKEYTFTLPKNPGPAMPSSQGVNAYAPTSLVASDGYIVGDVITTAMEYSIDNGQTWQPVTKAGSIRGLPSGKVLFRIAATATTEASPAASVYVPVYESNTDLDGDGGTSDGMKKPRRKVKSARK
jgi:hypothetical protein